MSEQQRMVALIRALSGQANILTVPRVYIDLTGDVEAALFLSQCVYWSDKTDNPNGFYKSAGEWRKELGFGHSKLDRCIEKTSDWVTYSNHRANGQHTRHFLVDLDKLSKSLIALLSPETTDSDTSENTEITSLVISEITNPVTCLTETTQKITNSPDGGDEKAIADPNNSRFAMMQALSAVCHIELKPNAGMLGSNAKVLQESGYTAVQVLKAYQGDKSWWVTMDWRGKRGELPGLGQIRQTIKTAIEGKPKRKIVVK